MATSTCPRAGRAVRRPTPPLLRVVERECQVYRRLWRGTRASTFLSPLLFLAAMGVGLGDLIDKSSGAVGGVSYLEFVAPGLMIASAVQLAAGEVVVAGGGGREVDPLLPRHGRDADPRRATCSAGFVIWNAIRTVVEQRRCSSSSPRCSAGSRRRGVCSRSPPPRLTAAAFCAPLGAFSVTQETDFSFPVIMRLGILPLFLFSGTFFPISELPNWLEPHRVALAALARRRARAARDDRRPRAAGRSLVHVAVLVACRRRRLAGGHAHLHAAVDGMIAIRLAARVSSSATSSRTGACGSSSLTGFAEPLLFLLSIGIGVGKLVGDIAGRRPLGSATTTSSRPGCSRCRR